MLKNVKTMFHGKQLLIKYLFRVKHFFYICSVKNLHYGSRYINRNNEFIFKCGFSRGLLHCVILDTDKTKSGNQKRNRKQYKGINGTNHTNKNRGK